MTQLSERTHQRLLQQLDSKRPLSIISNLTATLDASSSSSRTGATVDAERSFYEAQGSQCLETYNHLRNQNIKYEVVLYEFLSICRYVF